MSLNNIDRVKNNKLFKKADIIVYICLAVIVVALVLALNISGISNSSGSIVEISSDGVVVFSYDFEQDTYSITDGYDDMLCITEGDTLTLIIYYNGDETKYNIVEIDGDNGSVYMCDANCSLSHDCTYMSIENYSGSIICLPYGLMIYMVSDEISPPVTG